MVSSETVPFSKSGGLADVIGALSFALKKNDIGVRVLMPMYSFIDQQGFKKGPSFEVSLLGRTEKVETLVKKVEGVDFVGVCHPYFTERKGIYGDTSFTPYPDNAIRYAFFASSVIPYLKASGFECDIVHCHDWTTGLVPYLLKAEKMKVKSIYTIHNLAYQGEFSRYDALLSGSALDPKMMNEGTFGSFNMMKTGLEFADYITTVSPTYAKEICAEEQGCKLDWLLREREDVLTGIINGIDYKEWSPSKDVHFSEHYTAKNMKGKAALKARVQEESGLKVDPDVPLISMITRIADQKGFPELCNGEPCALEKILKRGDSQFIIVGTGDKKYEAKLQRLADEYDNFTFKCVFSNKVAHETEGASDFFLMPSRYEPCGLNQLYSLHYGTLPIAHRTGGLADSIIDIREDNVNGQGFLFDDMLPEEIEKTASAAIDFWYGSDKREIEKARKNGMNADFSWDKSAGLYIALYNHLANKGRRQK